jgi:CHAT domain-containing protein
VLGATDIGAFLDSVGSLIIETSGTGGSGDITLDAGAVIDWSSGNGLELRGDRSIILNPGSRITSTAGDIVLKANQGSVTTSGNFTGINLDNAEISTTSGAIRLTGRGGDTGSDNYGVHVQNGSEIGTVSGPIALTGTGGIGTGSNHGVLIQGSGTQIKSINGTIFIEGIAGSGIDAANDGISIASMIETTGNGTITLNGIGENGHHGIHLPGGIVKSNNAAITLNGTGGNISGGHAILLRTGNITTNGGAVTLNGQGGNNGVGIFLELGSFISSVHGSIVLDAEGTGQASGISARNDSQVTSVDGDIEILAQGGSGTRLLYGLSSDAFKIETTGQGQITINAIAGSGTLDRNIGLLTTSRTMIRTFEGDINIRGQGGAGTDSNFGIGLEGTINSVNGNINISGFGAGSSNGNSGLVIDNGIIRTTGSGSIDLIGRGGDGVSTNTGILIQGSTTQIMAQNNISLLGTGGDASGAFNQGVAIINGAKISSLGTDAVIQVNGQGGQGNNSNYGVSLDGSDTQISSEFGVVKVSGSGGGNGSGLDNNGINIEAGAQINSTGQGENAATITLIGMGGDGIDSNAGISLETGATINSENGAVSLQGTGGQTATGFGNNGVVLNSANVSSTGTGDNAATITIEGTGGAGTDANLGVLVGLGGDISSEDGEILIRGNASQNTTGFGNYGVGSFSTISSRGTGTNAATITISGVGGTGTNMNDGVFLNVNGALNSHNGDILVQGTANQNTTGSDNRGIRSDTVITSTGTGTEAAEITIIGSGGGGTFGNAGFFMHSTGRINSIDGAIKIQGTASETTSTVNNYGIRSNGVISSTGIGPNAATVEIEGTGGAGTSNNDGVFLVASSIDTVDGNILIEGTARQNTISDRNDGVTSVATITSTGSGADAAEITIIGRGGGGTNLNRGINLGGTIDSVEGNILIEGSGSQNTIGNGNQGVISAAIISSTGTGDNAATIRIDGDSGAGIDDNIGVFLFGSGNINSQTGAIEIDGTGGGGTGSRNHGILATGGSQISSGGMGTSAATIALTGVGGNGTRLNDGVVIEHTNTQITTQDGNLTIMGTGGMGTEDAQRGILVSAGAKIRSTGTDGNAATLNFRGRGGRGTDSHHGVFITGPGAEITSRIGAVNFAGTGGVGTVNNFGVVVNDGATIRSTGTGTNAATLNFTGTGGTGTEGNTGVVFLDNGTTITAEDGAIQVTGVGGEGTSRDNRGIQIDTGAEIISTGSGTNAAVINLNGTGGAGTEGSVGVVINDTNTQLTSQAGDIQITGMGGTGGSRNYGIQVFNQAQITSTGTGVDAAKIRLDGTGGNGSSRQFGVFINIGSQLLSQDGDITIAGKGGSGTGAVHHGLSLVGGAQVRSTGIGDNAAVIRLAGTGGDGRFVSGDAFSSQGVGLRDLSTGIFSQDGDIFIEGQGGNNQGSTGGQGVFIERQSQIRSAGTGANAARIMINGVGGTGTGAQNGVLLDDAGTQIISQDGDIQISGTGGSAGNSNRGIFLREGPNIISTGTSDDAARIILDGTGGNGLDNNAGVLLEGSGTQINTQAGDIQITGTGHGTGINNHGIALNATSQITTSGPANIALTGTASPTGEGEGIITTGNPRLGAPTTQSLILSGSTLDLDDGILQGQNLRIRPTRRDTAIDLGTDVSGPFRFRKAQLNALAANFSTLTLGREDSTGTITLNRGLSLNTPLILPGGSRIVGPNQDSTWTLTSENSGTFSSLAQSVQFANIETIDAGSGTDTIVGTSGNDRFNLNSNNSLSVSGINFNNIETINGGDGTDTLTASNNNDNFTLTGTNQGTLNSINFTSLEQLNGGSGDDTFNLNGDTFIGSIDGGPGNDTLQANSQNNSQVNTFTLTGTNSGTATDISGGFSNIENLTGGNTTNTIIFNPGSSLSGNINGSTGTLILTGDKGDINLSGTLTGSGILNIFPRTPGSGLDLNPNLLNNITPGFSPINIGQATTGNITIPGNVTLSAPLTLQSGQNITTAHITLPGQSLTLRANDTITSGNLTTASSGTNGGPITLIATTAITTGTLDSSSNLSNGGNIFIDPDNNVEIAAINSQGGPNGIGGNIDITTRRFLRFTSSFTDQNGILASLSSAGGLGGGDIILRHDGGARFVAFHIGDASQNGTAAAITTGQFTLSPVRLLPGPFTLGNIQIITNEPISSTDTGSCLGSCTDFTLNQPSLNQLQLSPSFPIAFSETQLLSPSQVQSALNSTDVGIQAILPGADQLEEQTKGFDEAQANLQDLRNETIGVTPAILHIRFVPTNATDATSESSQSPLPPTSLNPHQTLAQRSFAPGEVLYEFIDDSLVPVFSLRGSGETLSQTSAEICENNGNGYLELILISSEGDPVYTKVSDAIDGKIRQIKCQDVLTQVDDLQRLLPDTSGDDFIVPAETLYDWLIRPLEADLQAQAINTILFVLDRGLTILPMATLYDEESQQYAIEKYSLGLTPSLTYTDTRYTNLENVAMLAGGTTEFADTDHGKAPNPLPAAATEVLIASQTWPRRLDPLLHQDFNLDTFKTRLNADNPGLLHLATHADFVDSMAESYIQFQNTRLNLEEIASLNLHEKNIRLLALSACRTAVGNPDVGAGFAELGFSSIALVGGVQSVLGSLWYVDDTGTLVLMTEFYRQLVQAPTKAAALRQAQLALLQAQTTETLEQLRSHPDLPTRIGNQLANAENAFAHPFYWASFTLVGSPW